MGPVLVLTLHPKSSAGLGRGRVREPAKKSIPAAKAGQGRRWSPADWAGPRGRRACALARGLATIHMNSSYPSPPLPWQRANCWKCFKSTSTPKGKGKAKARQAKKISIGASEKRHVATSRWCISALASVAEINFFVLLAHEIHTPTVLICLADVSVTSRLTSVPSGKSPVHICPLACPGWVLHAGGRSRNIVDANLSVLREKMEVIKMRERLEKCCNNKHQQCGWNYAAGYNYKLRRAREVSTFFELMQLVCVTVGATCFTATLCLVLVSLLGNLNQ
ncbi:unnamed protein product [Prunus armeniaca]|uniref:Uncharacterized protein n=1 Tax=Prunus armeniaca TaxID=36596 RepID=A0A6J5WVY0_PRUAR|nr:unnamed protein product [Prunus armeniaca]